MAITCEQTGHDWHATTAPGWFCCQRTLGLRPKTGKLLYCHTVAVCPGCLGYALAGVLVVWCSAHQGLPLNAFPVVQPSSASADHSSDSFEQSSLW